ncbi:MAG: hypothetical protein KF709_07795 [Gemmatimonadaceae bacterium]|nr:hypothetical protein [Gemmatimonadaceae bacterium]
MRKLRSSNYVTIALCGALLLGLGAPTAEAQTPEQRRLDSLTIRLEDAEAYINMLRQQLATEADAGVRTRSRIGLEFSGRVLMHVFQNSKETNNADVPMYRKQVPDGTPKGGMGMTVRQSQFVGAVTVHDVFGGTFLGDIDVDFFGGQVPSPGGRTFPLMRIRTARAILEWENSQLLIGQEQPLVSNLNPISIAAIGAPNFSYSGNLWLWLPQIRYGWHTNGALRFGAQAAVLAPTSGEPQTPYETGFDAAERTGMPFVQSRLSMGWGEQDAGGEFGVGYHMGSMQDSAQTNHPSNAITVDFLVPLPLNLEIRGEAFGGQMLHGLGGGGIGQNFGVDSITPVRSVGGWVQINHRLSQRLLWGIGYGFDDPNDDDLPAVNVKFKNVTQEAHVHWRPAGPLLFGLEYRSVKTSYDASNYGNTHINLAFGFEF